MIMLTREGQLFVISSKLLRIFIYGLIAVLSTLFVSIYDIGVPILKVDSFDLSF